MKPLNDVWRNINREVGVYWGSQFAEVPRSAGVYAWFYPLRITSDSLDDFLTEVRSVFNFDARVDGVPNRSLSGVFTWHIIDVAIARRPSPPRISSAITDEWKNIVTDDSRFAAVRRSVMRASILMPPLYIGKADNLYNRCHQHLHGSNFSDRFERFADRAGATAHRVADLIFVCITTNNAKDAESQTSSQEVVEEILKHVCAPPYSKR